MQIIDGKLCLILLILWSALEREVEALTKERENKVGLPGVKIPEKIKITGPKSLINKIDKEELSDEFFNKILPKPEI